MTTPTMTWTRLARRLGTDHNPLRRRSDRFRAWLLPVALAVFLVLAPVAAGLTIALTHAANAATRQADQALHPVTATLLSPAPGPAGTSTWMDWAPARWTAGGTSRVTVVPVTAGTPAGTRVPVWLDQAGRVHAPPLTAGEARGRVETAVTLALSGLAAVLAAAAGLIQWRLNRRRLASWAASWRQVEPLWTLLERPEPE